MKDTPHMTLSQPEFLKAKQKLDRMIEGVERLASLCLERRVECCRSGALDSRDNLTEMRGLLLEAVGKMEQARAIGGRMNGDGIQRGGST